MKEDTYKCKYQSEDLSLPTSEMEVVYPINAFLEKTWNDISEKDVSISSLRKERRGFQGGIS